MNNLQASIGISQLKKLNSFVKYRKNVAKIYDKAVSKALKKIEAESKGKIKVSNEVIDKNDKQIKKYLGSEKPKVRQMAYEQSSKVLNISNLDLNVEQIMARFSKGGLVTAPSNGLMSR